ncbi:IS1380 family transposase [Haliangium sp.]|uniref:IS1380 family transposase n=1 Tax=Haliangium sp. TaxID=2663208 RepID=UPI003D1149D7
MRSSKAQVEARVHALPALRFEEQQLTSYSGAVVLQALFERLALKKRLARCFKPLLGAAYATQAIVLLLVVHLMVGCRQLRDRDYYADDPLIKRVVGLRQIPDVATITRRLANTEEEELGRVHDLNRSVVLERLTMEGFRRVTLDFDGSVITTRGHAEGSAVGYNRKHKGARSYYPLFCTVAQTGQIFDHLHRSGNVHDSNGARDFMRACFDQVRSSLPDVRLEARMDSAFFSEELVYGLAAGRVEFTVSLPFERFPELKELIESRKTWHRIDDTWSYADLQWKPKRWRGAFRVLAIRRRTRRQSKEPLQLDLFVPKDFDYEYKVILTNKAADSAPDVLHYHNGRGSQEGILGEAKSCTQLDYIPMRRLAGNRLFTLASVMAHNLGRELQIVAIERSSSDTIKRAARWSFAKLSTLRQRILLRPGRITRPEGKLTLTLSGNERVRDDVNHLLDAQRAA